MVKGISRQVIVVHAPEPKLFEQAIFIVSGEAEHGVGSADEMLNLASQLASRYTIPAAPARRPGARHGNARLRRALIPILSFFLGSGATALACSLLSGT